MGEGTFSGVIVFKLTSLLCEIILKLHRRSVPLKIKGVVLQHSQTISSERELTAEAPGSWLIKLALRLSTTPSYLWVKLAGESVQVVHGVRGVI